MNKSQASGPLGNAGRVDPMPDRGDCTRTVACATFSLEDFQTRKRLETGLVSSNSGRSVRRLVVTLGSFVLDRAKRTKKILRG